MNYIKNKQKGGSWLEAIIVVALVAYGLWTLKKDQNNNTFNNSNPSFSTNGVTLNNPNNIVSQQPLYTSYEQALIQYANSRVQLDENCKANPSMMVFKNNDYIMIDNRSSLSRFIKIGNNSFILNPYGFRVFQVTSSVFPVTMYLDCGLSLNVATFLVQK